MTCPGPLIWLAALDDEEEGGAVLECMACGYLTGDVLDPAHSDTPFLCEDAL
jgi:hypothetical protein